jgi:hypothetical protein
VVPLTAFKVQLGAAQVKAPVPPPEAVTLTFAPMEAFPLESTVPLVAVHDRLSGVGASTVKLPFTKVML